MKEEILILAKTYPTLSKKYVELVCTAGINRDGEWRRIYPIPFRQLSEIEKYKKFQWIEVDLARNYEDPRIESYRLSPQTSISIISEVIDTDKSWQSRKNLIFEKTKIYENLAQIIDKANTKNELSLAIFKPTEILDFIVTEDSKEWNKDKLNAIEAEKQQLKLFEEYKKEIKIVKKLPIKCKYRFKDKNGKEAILTVEDWEVGKLYWNCLKSKSHNEAINDVIKKYKDNFIKNKDLYFFLGTTRQYHGWGKNPFVIIGVFYPPKQNHQLNIEL